MDKWQNSGRTQRWLYFIYFRYYRINILNCSLTVDGSFILQGNDYTINVKAFYENKLVGENTSGITGNNSTFSVNLSEKHLWAPGDPKLYDLKLALIKNDTIIDEVDSYFGLREVSLSKDAILINNEIVFQRLVLDQGFYPDGVYTAPSDEALKHDIEISMGLGFNGARLHEKVFEQRYLYWADKLGYLVWGEYGNWGIDISTAVGLGIFLPEWLESVERDF